jgi:hypothetical protein
MKNLSILYSLLPFLECAFAITPSSILNLSLQATTGRNIARRQFDVGVDSQLTGTLYTVNITVGTPGQTVSLEVNTGSDELWVNPVCGKSSNPGLCQAAGRFTQSTTFVDLVTQGGQQQPDGTVDWEYGYDYVTVGRE